MVARAGFCAVAASALVVCWVVLSSDSAWQPALFPTSECASLHAWLHLRSERLQQYVGAFRGSSSQASPAGEEISLHSLTDDVMASLGWDPATKFAAFGELYAMGGAGML